MPIRWNAPNSSSQRDVSVVTFLRIPYNHACALHFLKLHTFQVKRHNLDALFFLFMLFLGSKFCRFWINNVSHRVPHRNVKHFNRFSVARRYFISARCATAANFV